MKVGFVNRDGIAMRHTRNMGIPELKSFDCLAHDPIDQWTPVSDADVRYLLCLHIGPAGEEGADMFDIHVFTPQAINEHHLARTLPKKRIIVNPYSWEGVLKELQERLDACAGNDWSQQLRLLAEHFNWEFGGRD